MKQKLNVLITILKHLNYNTIKLNFTYFKFKDAIRFPILVSCPFLIKQAKGSIRVEGKIHTGILRFGYDNIGHFDNARIRTIWEVEGEIVLKEFAHFGNGVKIVLAEGAKFVIGKNLNVAPMSTFLIFKELEFGENCIISWECQFLDTDFHHILDENGNKANPPKPIKIGNKVWITSRVTVLKGSQIADGCIVGNNSVVIGKLNQEKTVYNGNPCVPIKSGVIWRE